MDAVDVAAVQPDWVGAFCGCILETEEIIGHLGWAGHLAGTVQAQHQQVHHQAIVLYNERRKLEAPDDAVGVGVVHILLQTEDRVDKSLNQIAIENTA